MGLDIYKLQIQPLSEDISLEKAKQNQEENEFCVFRLDRIADYQKPLIDFVKNTGFYEIFKENVYELREELETFVKERNITFSQLKNWSYCEFSQEEVKENIDFYQNYQNKTKEDKKILFDLISVLPLIQPNKKYFQFSYKEDEDLQEVLDFIRFCKEKGSVGEIIIQDCTQSGLYNFQNRYLIVECLLKPKEIENIVWEQKETDYQRKGFKEDLSFFKKYYGSCWYVIENEETKLIDKNPMIYLMDNKVLQQVKITFEKDTDIQNWNLEKNEYIHFSA